MQVQPEGAYVKMNGKLIPGKLHMSDLHLTFKSQMDATLINAKVPLSNVLYVSAPVPTQLPKDAPMWGSLCGGAPMTIFQVVFQEKKQNSGLFGRNKKETDSISVNYIATADRLGALYAALAPYIGKQAAASGTPTKGGRRGRRGSIGDGTASIMMPAQVQAKAMAEALMAGDLPTVCDSNLAPAGWELRDSSQYPGRQFYYNVSTGKSQWEKPEPDPAAEVAATAAKVAPGFVEGQEVSVVKPVTGGFGMNIDVNCTVLSFIGEDSVARVAGVKIGTTIARIDGKKVKTRQDVVAILGPTSAGDSISFVLYTKEQLEELEKSRVQLAVQHGGQEGGGEPEPEPATGGGSYVSRFGKQTGGSDGEDDAGDGEDDAGDGTLVAAAVKGPTYVKTGFLVMKANGSFFDSVHAELVRLTDMPV